MSVESDWSTGSPVRYRTADGTSQIEGEILVVDPPRRLVTKLQLLYEESAKNEPVSKLSWLIAPMGDVCELEVTHTDAEASPATRRDVAICMPAILSNLKIVVETGKPRLIKEIVVDCESPARLGAFWAAALGYVMQGPKPTTADEFVAIADPLGVNPELGFQRVSEVKKVKNRLHFDLHVAEPGAEVTRLISLGASHCSGFPNDSHVLQDPEGNEFCVVGG